MPTAPRELQRQEAELELQAEREQLAEEQKRVAAAAAVAATVTEAAAKQKLLQHWSRTTQRPAPSAADRSWRMVMHTPQRPRPRRRAACPQTMRRRLLGRLRSQAFTQRKKEEKEEKEAAAAASGGAAAAASELIVCEHIYHSGGEIWYCCPASNFSLPRLSVRNYRLLPGLKRDRIHAVRYGR